MRRLELERFDPTRDFVVRRQGFFCAGRRYNAGDDFHKLGLTERQLNLFYKQRIIGYKGAAAEPSIPPLARKAKGKMERVPAVVIDSPERQGIIDKMVESNSRADLMKTAADLNIVVPAQANKAVIAGLIYDSPGNGNS